MGSDGSSISDQIVERSVFEVFHHVVGWFGIPADFEDLDDRPVAGHRDEVSDFAGQERPVDASSVKVELDCDGATCVQVRSDPNLSVGTLAQQPFHPVAGYLGRRNGRAEAQFLGPHLFAQRLVECLVDGHPRSGNPKGVQQYH